MRDAALDCGGFCADLLTEGLDFVGIAGKLLLSKAGCKRAIVNRKLLPQEKARDWLSPRIAEPITARRGEARADPDPTLSVGSGSCRPEERLA